MTIYKKKYLIPRVLIFVIPKIYVSQYSLSAANTIEVMQPAPAFSLHYINALHIKVITLL